MAKVRIVHAYNFGNGVRPIGGGAATGRDGSSWKGF